ncbi:MAG: polymer-forming cytoskeletal protein [Thermoplasmata archaeon]
MSVASVTLAHGSAAPTPPARPTVPSAPAPERKGRVWDRGVVQRPEVRALVWRADGTARILGNLDAGTVIVRGNASVIGKITADRIDVRGTLEGLQPIDVKGTMFVRGTLRFEGPLTAGTLSHLGPARGGGPIVARQLLESRGSLEVRIGGITAPHVALNGSFDVAGPILAKSVIARVTGPSQVPAIEAETVVLDRPTRIPRLLEQFGLLSTEPTVRVDRIEARDVYLDGVECEYVRSEHLLLGSGSHVTRLDGTVVRKHRSATIGPRSHTAPPHGLSR